MAELHTENAAAWASIARGATEPARTLQDTPEARLWTTVVLHAWKDLRKAATWLVESDQDQKVELGRGDLRRDDGSRREALEARRHAMDHQLRSCLWFFFSDGSAFEVICSTLDYDRRFIRNRVRSLLNQLGLDAELLGSGHPRTGSPAVDDHQPLPQLSRPELRLLMDRIYDYTGDDRETFPNQFSPEEVEASHRAWGNSG